MDIDRFLEAQDNGVYAQALSEIRNGDKRGHWIWFIFPQIVGLGYSSTSVYYAIRSREEAKLYLAHPILGERLRECVRALLAQDKAPLAVFGHLDSLKVRSSLTLFYDVAPEPLFKDALDRYYGGELDPRTQDILAAMK